MKKSTFISGVGLAAALTIVTASAAFAQFNPTPATSVRYSSVNAALEAVRQAVLGQTAGNLDRYNPATQWSYVAASGGITTTGAVTIKAAAGVAKKNYIRHLSISNSGAAGTEVIINCGASGTAIWRGWVGATASPSSIAFPVPLQCTANTLLEAVLSSGTTVAVRLNVQGTTD